MAFICTECKTKFSDKPQYCDCGNNLFEENKTDFLNKHPMLKRFVKSTDAFSASLFTVCIILSILIWFL